MAAGANVGVLAGATPYVLAWGVMMAAMMLPSAAPTIVLCAGMRRNAAMARRPPRLSRACARGSAHVVGRYLLQGGEPPFRSEQRENGIAPKPMSGRDVCFARTAP